MAIPVSAIYEGYAFIVLILGIICTFGGLAILARYQYRPTSRFIGLHPLTTGLIALAHVASMVSRSETSVLFWSQVALTITFSCQILAYFGIIFYRGVTENESLSPADILENHVVMVAWFGLAIFLMLVTWLAPDTFFENFSVHPVGRVNIASFDFSSWYLLYLALTTVAVLMTGAIVMRDLELPSLTFRQAEGLIIMLLYFVVVPFGIEFQESPVPNLGALSLPVLGLMYMNTFAFHQPKIRVQVAVEMNPTAWHDLRNIAAALNEQMEILRAQAGMNEQIVLQLANIEQVMRDLQKYMDQVNFPKPSLPSQIKKDEVWINGIVADACEFWHPIAQKHDLTWQTDLTTEEIITTLDPIWFKRTLDNLIHNAIKFTPAHGEVEVMTRVTDDQYRLQVRDTGIGIPRSDQNTVFQEYTRGANAAAFKGNGLGLASVSDFARVHEGQLELHSQEGEGTTITLILPLDQ